MNLLHFLIPAVADDGDGEHRAVMFAVAWIPYVM